MNYTHYNYLMNNSSRAQIVIINLETFENVSFVIGGERVLSEVRALVNMLNHCAVYVSPFDTSIRLEDVNELTWSYATSNYVSPFRRVAMLPVEAV